MIKRKRTTRVAAFARIDLLVGVILVVVLVILALPSILGSGPHRSTLIYCASNLKQVGLSFFLWAGENNDKFPQQLAGSAAYPLVNNSNAGTGSGAGASWPAADTVCPNMFTVFFSMSNELSNPKIMVCPNDPERTNPTNFYSDFALNRINGKNSKISYFVGKDSNEAHPKMILAGDRNISSDTTLKSEPFGYSPSTKGVSPGYIKAFSTNANVSPLNGANFGWTAKIHKSVKGNVVFVDGSVQQLDSIGLKAALQRTGDTNALQNVLLFP